jgi:hypothetical protein
MKRMGKSPVSCKDKKKEIRTTQNTIRNINIKTMTYATGERKTEHQKNNIKCPTISFLEKQTKQNTKLFII